MLPNLSVLWVIFVILVLPFVVDRLLLRPVLGVIRRREEAIESARELARRSATEAQAASAEFERKTAAARGGGERGEGGGGRAGGGARRAARRRRRRPHPRSSSGRRPRLAGRCTARWTRCGAPRSA